MFYFTNLCISTKKHENNHYYKINYKNCKSEKKEAGLARSTESECSKYTLIENNDVKTETLY